MRRKDLFYLTLGLALFSMAAGLLTGVSMVPQRAAAAVPAPGSSTAQTRPETLVVHLYFKNTIERDFLAQQWDASEMATTNGYLTVWVDRPAYNQMIAQGLKVEIDQATTRLANDPHLFGNDSPNTFYGGYKTVEEMQTFLDAQVAAHPTLAQKVDVGDSWCKVNPGCTLPAPYSGYDIWALHITNQAIAGPKPVFWYDAGIHSREIAVPEIAMLYISALLDNYDTDADAHWLVDYQDIWVIPMLNPDGHHIVESGGGGNAPYYQRKNSNNTNGCTSWPPTVSTQFGVDNNRNFPFKFNCCGGSSGSPCNQTYRGVAASSEPETQAVITTVRSLIPDQRGPNDNDPAPLDATGIYQNMHSNGALNLYPWGFTGTAAPNGAELGNIARHMQAANASPPGNSYQACQPPNCLYAVDGDANDWAYGDLGAASYTTEVGGSDFLVPLAYTTGTLWPANRGALVYQAKIARTPYLLAHGPDTSNVVLSPMTVTVGSTAQLTATINFAWTGNTFSQNVGDAEYYIDTPPWAGGTALPMTGSFTGSTVSASASVDTTGLTPGRHILFVRGRGVNNIGAFQTWGPMTAVFLGVSPVQGTPTPTVTGTPPSATPTRTPTQTRTVTQTPTVTGTATATPTVNPCQVVNYSAATGTATIVPGTQDIGSACDDCDVPINLPFPFVLYGQTFTSVNVNSNGRLDFATINEPNGYSNTCLPAAPNVGPYAYTIFAHWDDLVTTETGNGIFTSVSGSAPNRIFNIEWRACIYSSAGCGGSVNFEVRLYEGSTRFDLVYGALASNGSGATTGVQGPTALFTQYSCNTALTSGLLVTFTQPPCATPTPGGPTNTPTVPPTATVPPTSAASSTATVTATPTTCPVQFVDVPVGSTFYDFVRCLACRGIVGGYPCGGPGEPCPGNYYRPNNNVTRGQTAKIVSESAGFAEVIPSTQQTFEDVAPGSTFALWVERLAGRGIIGGYPCGGPFEPCVSPTNRPYFRPNNNVTRGQLSKITSGAAGWTETPTGQTFEDVAVGSTFYVYIERMASRGIISGYPCGGPFEPCVAPANRPYFRPNNNATRGQMSKIAATAFFPNCATPARR